MKLLKNKKNFFTEMFKPRLNFMDVIMLLLCLIIFNNSIMAFIIYLIWLFGSQTITKHIGFEVVKWH